MDVLEERVDPGRPRRARRSSSSSRSSSPSGCTAEPTGSSAIPTARTSPARRTPCSSSRPSSTSFDGVDGGVAKIVGVSDDHDAVAAAAGAARDELGDHVSASRSQPYYLDVTHPHANKGGVVALPVGALRRSRRTRSRRSGTCRTTCSCSRSRVSRSRWGTPTARCSARRTQRHHDERRGRLRERRRTVHPARKELRHGHGHPHAARNGRARSDGRRDRPAAHEATGTTASATTSSRTR